MSSPQSTKTRHSFVALPRIDNAVAPFSRPPLELVMTAAECCCRVFEFRIEIRSRKLASRVVVEVAHPFLGILGSSDYSNHVRRIAEAPRTVASI